MIERICQIVRLGQIINFDRLIGAIASRPNSCAAAREPRIVKPVGSGGEGEPFLTDGDIVYSCRIEEAHGCRRKDCY